jgi:hypothetical protein
MHALAGGTALNTKRDTTLTNATIGRMLFKWEVPLPTEAHRVEYIAHTDAHGVK